MLSKNKIKYIQSLCQKKQRDLNAVFLAEGDKITKAVIAQKPNTIEHIYATNDWIVANQHLLTTIQNTIITPEDLQKISNLQTPNQVVCILQMPNPAPVVNPLQQWVLVLDNIQDPGNMGTIIRLADWFGIKDIVCSNNSVDYYNTKVIQSTMGSFLQVNITYTNIENYLQSKKNVPIYSAQLNGVNVATINPKTQNGIIVIGNEGNGISPAILQLCNVAVTIKGKGKAESLNAAIATGIILSHLVQ
jgi:TrmH family RNA methyltransferase